MFVTWCLINEKICKIKSIKLKVVFAQAFVQNNTREACVPNKYQEGYEHLQLA